MRKHGRERRRRFVYTTRNTEYHVFDGVCIAVRDRLSGRWFRGHVALKRHLEGGIRALPNGALVPTLEPPVVGEPMFFSLRMRDDEEQVVTSNVEAVGRPDRDALERYPMAS